MSSVSISVPSLESDGPRSPATATPRSYGPAGDPASFDLGDPRIRRGAGPTRAEPGPPASRLGSTSRRSDLGAESLTAQGGNAKTSMLVRPTSPNLRCLDGSRPPTPAGRGVERVSRRPRPSRDRRGQRGE